MGKKKKAKQQQPVHNPKPQHKWLPILAHACTILGFALLVVFILTNTGVVRLPSRVQWPMAVFFSLLAGVSTAYCLYRKYLKVGSISPGGVELQFRDHKTVTKYAAVFVPILIASVCLGFSYPRRDIVRELAEALSPSGVAALQGGGAGLGTPVPSEEARELAAKIPANADPYALALKAIAERRFDDARRLLDEPEILREVGRANVHAAKGDAEFYAGRYRSAAAFYLRGVSASPDDEDLLDDAGVALKKGGRYQEAEVLLKRALGIREKVFGADHPDVAESLNNLGELYRVMGRHEDSERLHKRALGIWVHSRGSRHPDVATSLSNLGALYGEMGRNQDAEMLLKRALGIREEALGPDDPDVALTLNNLAEIYLAQRRYRDAELLLGRALGICERTRGHDHPFHATCLGNLASLYHVEGRHKEAEPLYRRAVEIEQKVLGRDHPDVATGLNNLGLLYYDTGRYVDAERLYIRALDIWKNASVPDHPNVATCLDNYAAVLRKTDRRAEAVKMEARVRAIREKNDRAN